MTETKNNDERFPEVKPTKPGDDTAYIAPIIGKLGYDTRRPWLFGLGTSPNNGVDFHVFLSFDGLNFDDNDIDKIWNGGTADRVKKEVDSATAEIPAAVSAASSAVSAAESAVAASKVNSDAIVAQSEAISEAKSAMDSATAEIQQTAANAASDAAKIRADVAQVQSEVDTAKTANSASVDALKSDINTAKQDLANVHDSLTKAQSAVEQNQKLINDNVAKISNDIAQDRKDLATAQQNNADLAKQLDDYSKQAEAQGKTIKYIQNDQNGFTATLADVKGNVSQVSDKVDGLSAGLKDAQDNVASIKVQANQLSATLTDHSKHIAQLTATAKELSSTLEDADGRLSKVEQTATEHTSTLSDLQGNLSQVKQTATGLVTTLKDAQGNIDQLQQTAKGTAEQISSLNGDIISLQKDVNGIKLTIADHDKNIHTLQADSKSLHDDMEDAQGNISSLQKTATSLDSEFEDHDGRISKVEQTANTLTNEFSDQQGHLNRVEQTAQGTQQTVANQQGQINTIKTDAAGIHETLTGQGNQIANINVTLSGLNTKYEGVSGDLNNLKSQAQWATVTSAVDLNNVKTPCHEFLKGTVTNAPNEVAWWYLTVEGSESGRITQTVIADQSNNRYTRRWADSWSAWVRDATQTDVTALSNRITANSTQITQNKKAIVLKADQSTVDNLSGEVSKNTAQLKVQAGQISSKVASTDFKTLNDKVNGIQVGGRNLITGTSSNWAKVTNDWGPNWSLNPDEWKAGDTITISAEIRNGSQNIFIGFYNTVNGQTITVPSKLSIPAGEEGRLIFAYKLPEGTTEVRPTIYPASGKGTFEYRKLKAEKGNVATDWTPAPEDLTTAIQKNSTAIDQTNQKISLKADQTEVDKIKDTATQNSSRLDVMANEISSKVTSTDVNNIVDSKGYATTSTVQSLITQKAGTLNESITNLSSKLNGLQVGGVNLVPNTDKDIVVESKATDTYSEWDNKWIYGPLTNGQTYTISVEATNTNGVQQASVRIYLDYDGSKYVDKEAHEWFFDADGKRHSDTFTVPSDGVGYKVYLYAGPMGEKQGKNFKTTYHHVKLEKGNVATDWSPAPSDNATVTQLQSVTASIDGLQSTVANKADKSQITQLSNVIQSKVSSSDFNDLKDKTTWKSTDSIDLNNAVSQQKIFVKGGSNLPPGSYWWYVRVEPGYASRIAQYATSDRDNKQYHRQYDGVNWSAWTQDASESEITQLRDDINLRVKSGDLLSQINLTAHNTLIQSNKIYLDADSVIMGPNTRAFIPSAAIINLDVAKLNAGTINTDRIHIGDDSVYLSVKNNYLRLDGSNTKDKYQLRLTGNDIEFADNDSSNWEYRIQHGINKYQTDEDGLDFDVYSKRGGANHTVMAVSDAGVMISPSLFFQTDGIDSSNWMGFTRNTVDGNSSVSFHTWDDNNEGFHVDCGARFMNYVYINGYARAQGWLTNSTLSKKTNIRKLDLQTALDKIRQDDQYLYEYKRNVAKGIYDPQASFIIDDVNDVAQYSVPREFIDQTGNYREPNVELAYLVAAFQALDKQVQEQNETIKKLEAKLNE